MFFVQGGDISKCTTLVDYHTEDGTANAGTDYIAASGTLTFQPGETECQLEVAVLDDDVFEQDEYFYVKLSNVRNGFGSSLGAPEAGELKSVVGLQTTIGRL